MKESMLKLFLVVGFVFVTEQAKFSVAGSTQSTCSFQGQYLPSLQALEMTCRCPVPPPSISKLKEYLIYNPVTILVRDKPDTGSDGDKTKLQPLYNPKSGKTLLTDVEAVADETHIDSKNNNKRSLKLILRVRNFTEWPLDHEYVCRIQGRDGQDGHVKDEIVLSSSSVKGLPPTTTTTTSTLKQPTTFPYLPPSIPSEDFTHVAATSGETEDGFSGVGLYITVALSCILVIVIVVAIIYFARVRTRRKQEKLDEMEDMDLDDFHPREPGPPGCNVIYKPGRGYQQPCHSTGHLPCTCDSHWPLSHSAACKTTDQCGTCPAVHSPCQPQTCAEIHRHGNKQRRIPQADSMPLLYDEHHGHGRHRRGSVTSEDEDEEEEKLNRRRERLVMDAPTRRKRSPRRDRPSPRHSLSMDVLHYHREESPCRRDLSPNRYSYGHRYVDVDNQAHFPMRRIHAPDNEVFGGHETQPKRHHSPRSPTEGPIYQDGKRVSAHTGNRGRHASDTDAMEPEYYPGQARRYLQTERERMHVCSREPPMDGRVQQGYRHLPDGPHPYGTTLPLSPSRRTPTRSASPPRRHLHYNTTPTPRHTTDQRYRDHHGATFHPRRDLSQPYLSNYSDSGAETEPGPFFGSESEDPEQLMRSPIPSSSPRRPQPPHHHRRRKRSRSVDGGVSPRAGTGSHNQSTQGTGRQGTSPEGAHEVVLHQVPPLSPAEEHQPHRLMNSLSRESLTRSRGPNPPPLNVPIPRKQPDPGTSTPAVAKGGGSQDQLSDTTHRKMPREGVQARTTRPGTVRKEGPAKPSGNQNGIMATASDSSSPGNTPPQDRRSSFSENDNPELRTKQGHPRADPEIRVSKIKTDYDKNHKLPVAVKESNYDVHLTPKETQGGPQAANARPRAAHNPPGNGAQERVRTEQLDSGSEQWHQQALALLDNNSTNGQLSSFTEVDHSTNLKTPPRPRPQRRESENTRLKTVRVQRD